jgi:hypothetical protein
MSLPQPTENFSPMPLMVIQEGLHHSYMRYEDKKEKLLAEIGWMLSQ